MPLQPRAFVFLLALVLVIPACTSFEPVGIPVERLREELALGNIVRIGDRVRIQLASGENIRAVVTGTTKSSLITSEGEIAFSDVVAMEAKVPDEAATTVAVLSGTVVLSVFLLSAALSSLVFMY